MKRLAYLSGLAGLLGVTFLVIHQGWDDVAGILAQGGWPLLWLLPLHALPLLLDARGWQGLLLNAAPGGHAGLPGLWWVASVREAVNRLLPTASVGGELVGIRLARLAPPDTTAVAASIVAEVLVTLFAQYLFTMAGVLMLLAAVPAGGHGLAILAGLVLSLPLPILFAIFVRRGGIFEKLENAARRMLGAGHKLAAMVNGARLDARIHALTAQPALLLRTLGWQLAGMTMGVCEVWYALDRLGHPVSFWQALAIEALTLAARQVAFFVPAGLGVQEAVVLLLGEMLGISPQVSLSLALVKRARELLFGVPALLSWQWLEWRQWRKSGKQRGKQHANGSAS
jgi:putative membrane protein